MAPDPAPPPIILAIPAPSPPPNPSSLPLNSDPLPSTSDLSSSPPDPACPSPVPAHPPPVSPVSASSSSPANQVQCLDLSRRVLPADLLCFQSFLPPSSSVEPSPVHLFPAAPEPHLPAAPEPHLPAQPADPQLRPQPVCRNVTAASVALSPLLQPPPVGLPHATAFPPLPSGAPAAPLLPRPADDSIPAQPTGLQQRRSQPVRHNAQATPISYAQATKGAPASGFVRAHAHDVDSFARLPRTGISAIRGSREGVPTFAIAQSDLPKVEGLYAKALVMKFHGGRPSLAESHKEISNWGLESPFSIGPLTSRSFLLRFQNERDLLKTLTRPSSTLIKFPYKIFRWHNRCHIKEESCVVPIWISLPRLPLQFFAPELLESIANSIGRFLCLDKATATLARPSEARMCVELDLRKERMQFIWIDLFEGLKQPIVYERVPKFCIGCHVLGHTHVECSKSSLDTPQPKDSGPLPAVQECPQPVRRNAAATDPLLSSDLSLQALPHPIVAAVQPLLQANAAATPPPLFPPSNIEAISSPAPSPSTAVSPANHLPAVHHILQSSVAAATHPPLSSSSPFPVAAAPSIGQDPCPTTKSIKQRSSKQVPSSSSRSLAKLHSHKSAPFKPHQPLRDYNQERREIRVYSLAREVIPDHIEIELHGKPLPLSIGLEDLHDSSPFLTPHALQAALAAAPPSPAPLPAMQSSLEETSQQPSPPSPPPAEALPSPCPVAAVPLLAPAPRPAVAVPPHAAVLSAKAPPFSPSVAAPSTKLSPTLNNQQPSSSLRSRSKFDKTINRGVMPQEAQLNHASGESFHRTMGDQGGLSSLINAPSSSNFPHQNHHSEGFESEGSFETDSQQYSPSGSPHKDVNKCIFTHQSCVSEGEELTEEHPGFQGHNSDVDFYHRPRSSKKNKRQPDGPLTVQLRGRKGPSSRK